MTVLVRLRHPWYETLRVSHRRAENRMSGNDSRIEHRDSWRVLGRTAYLLQGLNGCERQRQFHFDTRRKIDAADVPMAEEIVG